MRADESARGPLGRPHPLAPPGHEQHAAPLDFVHLCNHEAGRERLAVLADVVRGWEREVGRGEEGGGRRRCTGGYGALRLGLLCLRGWTCMAIGQTAPVSVSTAHVCERLSSPNVRPGSAGPPAAAESLAESPQLSERIKRRSMQSGAERRGAADESTMKRGATCVCVRRAQSMVHSLRLGSSPTGSRGQLGRCGRVCERESTSKPLLPRARLS